MFAKNVDSPAPAISREPGKVYKLGEWEINSVNNDFIVAFSKIIALEPQMPFKPIPHLKQIFKEDLITALNLFEKYITSRPKKTFRIKLRYLAENEHIICIACEGRIIERDFEGKPVRVAGRNKEIMGSVKKRSKLHGQFEQHQLITEGINAGIWDRNIKTGDEWWSDKFYDLLGYAVGEIQSSHNIFLHKLLHNDDRQKLMSAAFGHIKHNKPYLFDIRLRHKNGKYRWFEISGKAKFNNKGEPVRMVGAIVDREESKRLAFQLDRYKFLINQIEKFIQSGTWEYHIASGYLVCSQGVYDIYEVEQGLVQSEADLFAFFSEEEKVKIIGLTNDAARAGKPFDIELPFITGKQRKTWIRCIGMPIVDKERNVEVIRGIVLDIGKEKLREFKLLQYQKELEKKQVLLSETGAMAKVGGWEYDLSTETFTWSKEVYDIHELSPDIVPHVSLMKSLYTEDSRKKLLQAINKCIEKQMGYDLELMALTTTGDKKWVRGIGKPIRKSDGTISGIRGVVQDIDEMKKKEIELERSMTIINDQNKRLNNFAHIVSHNLKTHASNIFSLISLLEMSKSAEETNQLMIFMHKITTGLSTTIDHLNDIVKIQTAELTKQRIDIAIIFSKIIDILAPTINKTGATILSDFEEINELDYVPAYLESIMLNLLSNAIKYRHPERDLFISVKSFAKDNKQYLQVKDNGIGIDTRHHKNVFGMYQTFHENPDAKGMGLFITKNQVEALGGNITFVSEVAKGSSFLVQF